MCEVCNCCVYVYCLSHQECTRNWNLIWAASSKAKWVARGETIKFHQRALYDFWILYQVHVLPIQINNDLQHWQPCFKQKQHKMWIQQLLFSTLQTQRGQEKQRSGYYLEEAERKLQRIKHNLKSHQMILRIRIQPGKPGKPEGQNWVEKWSVPTGEVGGGARDQAPPSRSLSGGWGETFKERGAQPEDSCPWDTPVS